MFINVEAQTGRASRPQQAAGLIPTAGRLSAPSKSSGVKRVEGSIARCVIDIKAPDWLRNVCMDLSGEGSLNFPQVYWMFPVGLCKAMTTRKMRRDGRLLLKEKLHVYLHQTQHS